MGSLLKSTRNTRALPTGNLRFIPSDFPGKLTDAEIMWLRENDITTVIDLRDESEYKERPCRLEEEEGFVYLHMPVTGGGGVPLAKRNFGESVGSEIDHFGYWWCKRFARYAGAEKNLPFDQHMLLSCIAPRPLLVEGFNNPWFDTHGEFLALQAASPVWTFLGAEGLPDVEWPGPYETQAIGPILGYVRREGSHGISAIDWEWILDFADGTF